MQKSGAKGARCDASSAQAEAELAVIVERGEPR